MVFRHSCLYIRVAISQKSFVRILRYVPHSEGFCIPVKMQQMICLETNCTPTRLLCADSRIFEAVEEFHLFSPFCSVISFHQKLLFSHLIVDPCCHGVCGQGGGGRVADRTRSQQCRVAFAESEGRKI